VPLIDSAVLKFCDAALAGNSKRLGKPLFGRKLAATERAAACCDIYHRPNT
jgi:hypothetical protein